MRASADPTPTATAPNAVDPTRRRRAATTL
jgi:hypothetical protein